MSTLIIPLRHATACAALAVACAGLPAPSLAADSAAPDATPIFKTLHVMRQNSEGGDPQELIQASDGNLYGVAFYGGAFGVGTIYRMTPDRSVQVLHDFNRNRDEGAQPIGKLLEASDGNFYGVTWVGGAHSGGTIYRLTPDGEFTVLHAFNKDEGSNPQAGLIQARDGMLYGTANTGGTFYGVVFRMALDGTYTVLHTFDRSGGSYPYAPLVEARDGLLHGTTVQGGRHSLGTIFSITTGGEFTLLHSFTGADGSYPVAPLIQASDGQFFGTTTDGGPNGVGTVFRMTPKGGVIVLHSFPDGSEDGQAPAAGLLDAGDGYLYGTASRGGGSGCGAPDCGIVFRLGADGAYAVIHTFAGSWHGLQPDTGLTRVHGRGLVGTTTFHGDFDGTIYGLWEPHP